LIHAAQDINPTPSTSGHDWSSSLAVHVSQLYFKYSNNRFTEDSSQRCYMCAVKEESEDNFYHCEGYDVGLCI
jgi:hypothetical protein